MFYSNAFSNVRNVIYLGYASSVLKMIVIVNFVDILDWIATDSILFFFNVKIHPR